MGLLPLEFTECLQDSPYFRDSLHSHEKELERTSNNIKDLIKEVKCVLSAARTLSRAQRRLSDILLNFKFECIGNQQTDDEIIIAGSLREFGRIIGAVEDEKERMLDQVAEFIVPLENFRKDQIGAVKEGKKKFDKQTAKFCASQERHLSLSRKKQDTILQDADATLEMEQRDFIRAGLEYVCLIQEVQERKKFEFVETLLGFMYGWLTFYNHGHEVAKDYKPHMTELQASIQKTRENFDASRADIQALMRKMLEVRQSKSIDPGTLNRMYTRSGYLFLMEKKALGTTWTKCYCHYQREGRVFCMIPYNQTTAKIVSNDTFRLKTCVRRISDSIDKRFCFDIVPEDKQGVSSAVCTFQALSEEDCELWLDAMDGKEPMFVKPSKPGNAQNTFLDEAGFAFMSKCFRALESRGLEDQGLYRVVGVTSKVNRLLTMGLEKRKLEKLNFDDHTEIESKTITSAVKTFLRNLPEPIMTFRLHSKFIAAAKLDSYDARVTEVRRLVQQLPEPSKRMLELLASHLEKVAANAKRNKMTVSNLGVCFGPTLLRNEEETVAAIMDIKFGNVAVEILIENWRHIIRGDPPLKEPRRWNTEDGGDGSSPPQHSQEQQPKNNLRRNLSSSLHHHHAQHLLSSPTSPGSMVVGLSPGLFQTLGAAGPQRRVVTPRSPHRPPPPPYHPPPPPPHASSSMTNLSIGGGLSPPGPQSSSASANSVIGHSPISQSVGALGPGTAGRAGGTVMYSPSASSSGVSATHPSSRFGTNLDQQDCSRSYAGVDASLFVDGGGGAGVTSPDNSSSSVASSNFWEGGPSLRDGPAAASAVASSSSASSSSTAPTSYSSNRVPQPLGSAPSTSSSMHHLVSGHHRPAAAHPALSAGSNVTTLSDLPRTRSSSQDLRTAATPSSADLARNLLGLNQQQRQLQQQQLLPRPALKSRALNRMASATSVQSLPSAMPSTTKSHGGAAQGSLQGRTDALYNPFEEDTSSTRLQVPPVRPSPRPRQPPPVPGGDPTPSSSSSTYYENDQQQQRLTDVAAHDNRLDPLRKNRNVVAGGGGGGVRRREDKDSGKRKDARRRGTSRRSSSSTSSVDSLTSGGGSTSSRGDLRPTAPGTTSSSNNNNHIYYHGHLNNKLADDKERVERDHDEGDVGDDDEDDNDDSLCEDEEDLETMESRPRRPRISSSARAAIMAASNAWVTSNAVAEAALSTLGSPPAEMRTNLSQTATVHYLHQLQQDQQKRTAPMSSTSPASSSTTTSSSATATAAAAPQPLARSTTGSRSDRVRTLYACVGEHESELSFEPNQIIVNVRPSLEPGWLHGCLDGTDGLVPENYVEYI